MTYREAIELYDDSQITLQQLQIGLKVREIIKPTSSKFEEICSYIYSCYQEQKEKRVSIEQLINYFHQLNEDGYTEEEILQIRYYNFRDMSQYC